MKNPAWLACFLLVWMQATFANAPRDPYQYFFDETFGDFSEELERAKEEGKKGILLFFEMDECPFCHRMKDTVLNQVSVQDYFRENFLNFSVDIEGDVEITDFSGKTLAQKDFATKDYKVRATPVFAFIDLDGKLVARYTGAASGPEEFLWLGEYVSQEYYKEEKFARFKRKKRKQRQ